MRTGAPTREGVHRSCHPRSPWPSSIPKCPHSYTEAAKQVSATVAGAMDTVHYLHGSPAAFKSCLRKTENHEGKPRRRRALKDGEAMTTPNNHFAGLPRFLANTLLVRACKGFSCFPAWSANPCSDLRLCLYVHSDMIGSEFVSWEPNAWAS